MDANKNVINQMTTLPTIKTAGVLGMLIYGIFDFTNLAIFNKLTVIMSIMDITWGGMLFATVTIILRNFEF